MRNTWKDDGALSKSVTVLVSDRFCLVPVYDIRKCVTPQIKLDR